MTKTPVPTDSLVTELQNLTPLERVILEKVIPAVKQAAVDLPANTVQGQEEIGTTKVRRQDPQVENDQSAPRMQADLTTQSVNQIQQRLEDVEEGHKRLQDQQQTLNTGQETLEKRQQTLDKFTTKVGMIFRGVPLILIVLAVIGYPLYGMIFNINAQDLAQYIAPVSGLAGAIIGYWFGQGGQVSPGGQGSQGGQGS